MSTSSLSYIFFFPSFLSDPKYRNLFSPVVPVSVESNRSCILNPRLITTNKKPNEYTKLPNRRWDFLVKSRETLNERRFSRLESSIVTWVSVNTILSLEFSKYILLGVFPFLFLKLYTPLFSITNSQYNHVFKIQTLTLHFPPKSSTTYSPL